MDALAELDNFQLLEKLYDSPRSVVYRAQRKSDQRRVVIKAVQGEYPDPRQIAGLEREFQLLDSLDLPGVIKVHELGWHDNQCFLVMEDLAGESLDKLNLAGRLSLLEFLDLALKITDILGRLHQAGIILRDLNPSNLVLNPETGRLVVIDLGLAVVFSSRNQGFHNPNTLEGTLGYISPEQTGRMNRATDYRTDFYSLGVTLYEMLTGRLPFLNRDPLELVHAHLALQPPHPHELRSDIPTVVSAIIDRLMAKNAGDRYQSTAGLRVDLARCRDQWQDLGRIEGFVLGSEDRTGVFHIPQKLYERQSQTRELMEIYQRVVDGGAELVLVAGGPGTGKTVLVQEIYRPLTRDRGFFLAGKFDQMRRGTPYSAFLQAMEEFVDLLLTEDETSLRQWSVRLKLALGDLGAVLTDVLPTLERLVGPQRPAPELKGPEARNRFHYLFRRVVKAMARADHPVVFFLDDWQWADSGSIQLLKNLWSDPELGHFLIVCAYRDNEVDAAHPFNVAMRGLGEQRQVKRIEVNNLSTASLRDLLLDTLHPQQGMVELAALVKDKTRGNAFFVNRFLYNLHQQDLLNFDHELKQWTWDLERIKSLEASDNVADLLGAKLTTLPEETQRVLTAAALLGNVFDLATLEIICADVNKTLNSHLEQGVVENLLLVKGRDRYAFAHDRVQQAARDLIPPSRLPALHLEIGRKLLGSLSAEERELRLFEVVDHLNMGDELIDDPGERLDLAGFNMRAGRKARSTAVFKKAWEYFKAGLKFLPIQAWQQHYELTLDLHTQAAAAAYLSGDYDSLETLADTILNRATSVLDKVKIHEIRIQAANARVRPKEAVDIALDALALLGLSFPAEPTPDDIGLGLGGVLELLKGRKIADLAQAPLMQNARMRAVMGLIAVISDAAFHVAPMLLPLLVFEQVRLSIEHGNAPESPPAYALFGLILCGPVGDIESGFTMGELALELLDRLEADEYKSKTLFVTYNCVLHWKQHNRLGLPHFQEAYQSGLETGDLTFAAISAHAYCYNAFFLGHPLPDLLGQIEAYDRAIAGLGQMNALYYHRCYYQTVLNLLGRGKDPTLLVGDVVDLEILRPQLEAGGDRTGLFVLHFCNALLSYYLGRPGQAADELARAREYLDGVTALIHVPMEAFLDSLIRLDGYREASPDDQAAIRSIVEKNQARLGNWAEYSPQNHGHKHCLVEAESRRHWGDSRTVREHYERALRLAAANGYLNEEILAHELYGRFLLEENEIETAAREFQKAYHCCQRWGAAAKLDQMADRYRPHLVLDRVKDRNSGRSSTLGPLAALDVESILKTSQILSSEMNLARLLDKMMLIAMENLGANRGAILENRDGKLEVQTLGQYGRTIDRNQKDPAETTFLLPDSVLNFVYRSQESLVLEDLLQSTAFYRDPAFRSRKARSVLGYPVLHKGDLTALIYLENDLIAGAFTSDRLEFLKVLAAQLAISLENARLYHQLELKVEERAAELAQTNQELRQAMQNVKQLIGLLPICANCKRIRDDQGYWQQVEDYVQKHSDAEFSHSICPSCLKKLYPEFADSILKRLGHE